MRLSASIDIGSARTPPLGGASALQELRRASRAEVFLVVGVGVPLLCLRSSDGGRPLVARAVMTAGDGHGAAVYRRDDSQT